MASTAGIITPEWELPAGVQARLTTRAGGISQAPYDGFNLATHVGDNRTSVLANRRSLLRQLVGVRSVQWLTQVHSNWVVQAYGGAVVPVADASSTEQSGLACAVLTADCLPVLFCRDDGRQVAAAHAGWRGLADGILLHTLKQFPDPKRVFVYLAPCIGPSAFEVGPEVKAAFGWASSGCFIAGAGDRWLGNLQRLAAEQLLAAGVRSISANTDCTVMNSERYFSYRRDGDSGRQASLIWIES
jgi:YfiH family protein